MTEEIQEKRRRFLQVAYDLSINEPVPWVSAADVARELGEDPEAIPFGRSQVMRIAQYFGNKGLIKSQADGYGLFSLTPQGIDEVEGTNKPQPQTVTTNFNISGPVHGSVIGTHNTTELTNNFDFRSVEQRIENEGGEDEEELYAALEEVRNLLESGESLDRGALSEFSGVMERHSWFTGAVAAAIIGFATQMVGG